MQTASFNNSSKLHLLKTSIIKKFSISFLLVLLTIPFQLEAQNENDHELTLYVMPTLQPLNWESPSTLYKSMRSCLIKTIARSDNYLLGHVAVKLKSTLLSKPILIAQTSGKLSEKLNLLFKEKVGFSLLGLPITGRLETEKELEHNLRVYRKREKLAFIRYQISELAAQRIIKFIDEYSSKDARGNAACEFYGGAFWPRYYGEGAGCSTFGAALLDINNLLGNETDIWKLELKIPMHLIGGEVNNGRKIKIRDIKKTDSWFTGAGIANQDYAEYKVYEPSIMFDWILNKRETNDSVFIPIEENTIPGLLVKAKDIKVNENEELFHSRTKPNLFIDHFKKKFNLSSNK